MPRHTVVRVIARTNVGGPALQVTALMRGLDPDRFPQHLLRGSVDVGEADYLELRAPDVAHVDVPGLGRSVKLLDDLRALVFLTRYLRRVRPTIVHTHTAKAGTLGRIAAVLARVPVRIHTFHGHVLHGYFSLTVTRAVVLVERALAMVTTHTVAVGEQVLDDLVAAKIARRRTSSVVAPGVQELPTRPADEAKAALGAPTHRPTVTFVGRLTGIKRAERFIDVARALATRVDATFVVVGDGPDRADLESRAAGLDNVVFAGWQGDMGLVYSASDLLVLTSDNEGMPVALIEGAMHGVPAVSTDVGAVRQVVEHEVTGLVVDDPGRLEAAVERLLTDAAERSRMGAAAQARSRELFGEQRLVADYAALYDRLVATRRAGRASRRA